jgi:pyruvate dehydrogenase E1 component beta subunit
MREIEYIKAVTEALDEEMERDKDIFLIGEDIGQYGGVFGATKGLYRKYGPERVKQTPISESAIIGAAMGAAITGLRPVAEIMYFDFITLAVDQLVNQAAKIYFMSGGQINVPMVVRTQYATGTTEAAQHSQNLESWFAHVPGLKVVMPYTATDVKGLLKSAIRDNNPVLFIENRVLYYKKFEIPDDVGPIEIGKADIKREGRDVTLISAGMMVERALEAADELTPEIDVEVVDLRTIYPIDMEMVKDSVKKTGKVLVAHEAVARFGWGAELVRNIAEQLFDYLDFPPKVLGNIGVPIPYSVPLEEAAVPQKSDIIDEINKMF